VIIVGTIKCVHENVSWYYDACTKCNKKVTRKLVTHDNFNGTTNVESKYVFECNNVRCVEEVISALPRYTNVTLIF
jgi:hypothetical protein